MRIAILADIHGNVIALDAVLDDARSAGAEQFWVIGDLCAIGPEPVRVLERLAEMDGVVLTRGNTDRYVVTGEGPPPTLEAVQRDPTLVATYAGIRESFAWTRGFLVAAELGHVCPVHHLAGLHGSHHAVEAQDAGIELGRQPHLPAEAPDEVPLADAEVP
jgi:hypothetical protein